MERWSGRIALAALLFLLCYPAQAQEGAFSRADAAYAKGNFTEAVAEYEKVVEDYPGHPTAWLRLARLYAELEEWDKSADAFEKLIGLGPVDRALRMEYGDVLREQGEVEAAVEQYNLAVHSGEGTQNAEELLASADEAYLEGRMDTALQFYRRITQDYPGHPTAWLRLARLYGEQEKWDSAAEAWGRLDKLGPLDPQLRLEYGDVLRENGQLELALEQYNVAVKGGADPDALPALSAAELGPLDMDPRAEKGAGTERENGDREYVIPVSDDEAGSSKSKPRGDKPSARPKRSADSPSLSELVERIDPGMDEDESTEAVDVDNEETVEAKTEAPQSKQNSEPQTEKFQRGADTEDAAEPAKPAASSAAEKDSKSGKVKSEKSGKGQADWTKSAEKAEPKPQLKAAEPEPEEEALQEENERELDSEAAEEDESEALPVDDEPSSLRVAEKGDSPALKHADLQDEEEAEAEDEEDKPQARPFRIKLEKPSRSEMASEKQDSDTTEGETEEGTEVERDPAEFFRPLGQIGEQPSSMPMFFVGDNPDFETIVILEGDVSEDPALLDTARAHARAEEWSEAVTVYEELIAKGPVGVNVRIDYADALAEAGQLDRAEQEFNRVLHADADSVDAKIGLAKVMSLRGELDEAMYLLDQLAADPDAFAKTRLARAYAFYANEYFQETWRDIGDLIASIPGNEDIVQMINSGQPWEDIRAELESRPGNEEVIELIEKLNAAMIPPEEQMPDDPAGKADFLFRRGEYEQAMKEYESLSKDDPANALAWLRLGNIFTWNEDYESAIDALETYLALVPGDAEGRLRYGTALALGGRSASAQDVLWELVSDTNTPQPIYREAVFYMAVATSICGQAREAVKWFREALALDPDNLDYRAAYGSALTGDREFDTAKAQFRMVLDENPQHAQARLGLAQAYAAEGDIDNARYLYNELIMDENPEVAIAAKIGKAYTLLWDGKREEAESLAYSVNREDPENKDLCSLFELLDAVAKPLLTTTYTQRHDNEDNDYNGLDTQLIVPLSPEGAQMTLGYEDFSLDNTERGEKSSGTNTKLSILTPFGREVWWRLSANYLDIENDEDPPVDFFGWGTGFHIEPDEEWNGGIAYDESMFYETAQLARNAVELQEWSIYSDWALGNPETRLVVNYLRGELSDGNSRDTWIFDLRRVNEYRGSGMLTSGIVHRRIDYAQTSDLGYWDPQNYSYTGGYLDWTDMSDNPLLFDVGIGFGLDSEPGRSGNGVFDYRIGIRYLASDDVTLRAGYQTSDARTNGSTSDENVAYNSKMWYLGGDFQF